jgi:SWI/SNF-related matrix-associated actin-dependent regulator 1 of chromatin subfamily A
MYSSTPPPEKKEIKLTVGLLSALKDLGACSRLEKYGMGAYHVRVLEKLNRRRHRDWQPADIESAWALVGEFAALLQARGVPVPVRDQAEPAMRRAWLEEETALVTSDYHPEMSKRLQYIPKAKFDRQAMCWRIPVSLNSMESLLHVLVEYSFAADAELIRKLDVLGRVVDEVATESRAHAVDEPLNIPTINGALMPYQHAGIHYLVDRKRSFLADDMGLGKTVQSLAAVEYLGKWPIVVVCPGGLIFNWGREIARWLPGRTFTLLPADDIPDVLPASDIYVVGYDTLSRVVPALRARKPQGVIFDEFHYLKERKTKRFTWAKKLVNRIDVRLGLSGTPMPNRPSELVAQLQILGLLNALGGLQFYLTRYCAAKLYGTRLDTRGASNLEELNAKLRGHGFLRRIKREVLKELPQKTRTYVPMGMDHPGPYLKAKEKFNALVHALAESRRRFLADPRLATMSNADKVITLNEWLTSTEHKTLRGDVLAAMGTLRRVAARGRLSPTIKFIEDALLEGAGKVIVFAHHREMVANLREAFPDAVWLDEAQKPQERQAMVDRFQDDPEVRVIIAPIKIGYVGYNMTAANQVIFAEMDWVPSVHDQAEDRALRIGQTENVTAWYLYASGTIEEKMIAILEAKRSVVTRATDGSPNGDEGTQMFGELLVRLGADAGEEERFLVAGRLREHLAAGTI